VGEDLTAVPAAFVAALFEAVGRKGAQLLTILSPLVRSLSSSSCLDAGMGNLLLEAQYLPSYRGG